MSFNTTTMTLRTRHLELLKRQLANFPVVAILGARQVGKTTLARQLEKDWVGPRHHFDLEDPNGSELARSLGVSDKTVSRYLDILEGTFMANRLPPWYANVGKREVKAPRVYVADTGLLHSLLGIGGRDDLLAHPKCGASWEGFILREVIRRTGAKCGEAFFWGVHSGAELDLLILQEGRRMGFEIKLTSSPQVTASMRTAKEILRLDHLYVMCHGEGEPWALAEGITAIPAAYLATEQ